MKASKKISLIVICILLICFGNFCKKQDYANIPNVYVDINIDVTSTIYMELNHVGGWLYLTGGVKGILVYRSSVDEFMTFERCCTYDADVSEARIEVDSTDVMLVDKACGSVFLILDGSIITGPATIALKRYRNNFDGTYLRIYN